MNTVTFLSTALRSFPIQRTPHSALCALLLLIGLSSIFPIQAQTSVITYQGQLRNNGTPFTGMVNLEFRLYDALVGGNQIGSSVNLFNWPVEDGLFQAGIDFGAAAFDGSDRWLEVWVNGAPLTPRQQVTSAPYAVRAGGLVGGLPPAWLLGGNAGTNANTNFLGTTDNQPLVLRTNNAQSLRIEPSAEVFNGLPITANVIAGSHANNVTAGVRGATIAGGGVPSGNSDPDLAGEAPNRVTDHYGSIGGGYGNQAGDDAGGTLGRAFATVGGGLLNTASGPRSTVGGGSSNTASETTSTVGGGSSNTAGGTNSTVGGGYSNTASGSISTVGGGTDNTASGYLSTVSGGTDNTASGYLSTVSGGTLNCAGGEYSWAGGRQAKVRPGIPSGDPGDGCNGVPSSGDAGGHNGTFVWADSQGIDFVSTGPNRFLVRASGGIWFGTGGSPFIPIGRFINTSTGAYLSTGGTWTNASSRALKQDFTPVDPQSILNGVMQLDLATWRYRESDETRHLGPVAEDFQAIFGLGDGQSIATVDADGVALAAIQGLNQKLEKENAALRAESTALREDLADLKQALAEKSHRLASIDQKLAERDQQLAAFHQQLAELRELIAPQMVQTGAQ